MIFDRRPVPDPLGGLKGWGQKVKIQPFQSCCVSNLRESRMQQHESNFLFIDHPRSWRSKYNFFRTWSCCISNEMESQMQQHCSKYFLRSLPPQGIKRSKFFRQWHVAYSIIGNHECNYMVAKIKQRPCLQSLGTQKVKVQFFSEDARCTLN